MVIIRYGRLLVPIPKQGPSQFWASCRQSVNWTASLARGRPISGLGVKWRNLEVPADSAQLPERAGLKSAGLINRALNLMPEFTCIASTIISASILPS
jgi:hypothetical protein